MPRFAQAQLRWSELAQTYTLFLENQPGEHPLTSAWLEQYDSFAFHSRAGHHMTVRKQKGQRGSSYWYGYRRLHGRLSKRYLGKTEELTPARLEEVALLHQAPAADALARQFSPESAGEDMAPEGAQEEAELSPAVFPLLLSKLSPPRLPQFLLDRPQLFALLDAGREKGLTLLSAPAGFGKTTLVSQWLAARRGSPAFPPVAWFSLESSDNDLLRFWRYLITACEAFHVDLTQAQQALAEAMPQPPFLPSVLDSVLVALLNALVRASADGILVLEEYHAITEPAIHETLVSFLEHLPASIHVILISRVDPPFSLARLRARNRLCEVRGADLSFSPEETGVLLHHALPFALSDDVIRRLHAQLEGWVTGLHLLSLALQRTSAPLSLAETQALFSRHQASFQEYFVNEVIAQQSEDMQAFLLQTSILSHLSSSLCDAVTGQPNGQEVLNELARNNLFLEQLDFGSDAVLQATHQWYRYHALFAETLRQEAHRRLGAEQVRKLWSRASRWYEAHDQIEAALDAALEAQEWERAATMLEQTLAAYILPGTIREPHMLRQRLARLPESILEQHPILSLSDAIALLLQNATWQPTAQCGREIERRLQSAERGFQAEQNVARLGELTAFRALYAMRQGVMPASVQAAQQALNWLEADQQIWRGLALSIASEAWIRQGAWQTASTVLLEAHALCEAGGNRYFHRMSLVKLAGVCFEKGESPQAVSLYRQALASVAAEKPSKPLANWHCAALIGLANVSYAVNELERAAELVQEAISLSQEHSLLQHAVQATILLARIQHAQGEVGVAQQGLAALLDAIPITQALLSSTLQTAQASLALAGGEQLTVYRWATHFESQPLDRQPGEDVLLFCRWLRVQGKGEEAAHHLEQLREASQKSGHVRRLLEIQVEFVLTAVASKRKAEALDLLHQVLLPALASNARRIFLDAGNQIAILLRALLGEIREQALQAFIRELLQAFPQPAQQVTQPQSAALVEPLTPQEERVLALLGQHFSTANIADTLVVSVNTVRTQMQRIYGKLGVHSRAEALTVARELNLLA